MRIVGRWKIEIVGIESKASVQEKNRTTPTYSGTPANFGVNFYRPWDKMKYTITVKNTGNLKAILDTVEVTISGSAFTIYGIEGLESQVRLEVGASISFKVTAEFDKNATNIPSAYDGRDISILITCVQDAGQKLTSNPVIIDGKIPTPEGETTLAETILLSNVTSR